MKAQAGNSLTHSSLWQERQLITWPQTPASNSFYVAEHNQARYKKTTWQINSDTKCKPQEQQKKLILKGNLFYTRNTKAIWEVILHIRTEKLKL